MSRKSVVALRSPLSGRLGCPPRNPLDQRRNSSVAPLHARRRDVTVDTDTNRSALTAEFWPPSPSCRLGQAATDYHLGSESMTINTHFVGAGPHKQRSSSSILLMRPAPTAGVFDGSHHIRWLEFHIDRYHAPLRSIGMLHGIRAGLTDSDEQISDHPWSRAHGRQPTAHAIADILQRPRLRRHHQV